MDRPFDPALYARFDDAWEAGMYEAKPCHSCLTTGGALKGNSRQPWRARGLCSACYNKHFYAGTLEQFSKSDYHSGHPQPVPARVELTHQPMNWSALSTQEWHDSIARDNARTWATAAWVGRSEAA